MSQHSGPSPAPGWLSVRGVHPAQAPRLPPARPLRNSLFATSASLPAAGFLAVLDVDHLPAAVDFALESAPSREHTSRVTFRVRVCLFSEATLGLVPCSLSLCISGPFEISRRAAAPRPPEAGGQRLGV